MVLQPVVAHQEAQEDGEHHLGEPDVLSSLSGLRWILLLMLLLLLMVVGTISMTPTGAGGTVST